MNWAYIFIGVFLVIFVTAIWVTFSKSSRYGYDKRKEKRK